jgi:hypothetical protein
MVSSSTGVDGARISRWSPDWAKIAPVSVFGAVSTTVLCGDFLSGCLVLFASLFMVFKISLEIETQKKGKK